MPAAAPYRPAQQKFIRTFSDGNTCAVTLALTDKGLACIAAWSSKPNWSAIAQEYILWRDELASDTYDFLAANLKP